MKRSSIRWEEVRRRLQASENALQEDLSGSPERIEAVYRRRAIQLAKGNAQDKPASGGVPALIFRLARERYAIELEELTEVLPFRGCTQVPGTSPTFLGVINVRGELRPVIDLGMVLSERPGGDSGFVLMLRRQAGLKVDEIEDLGQVRPEELARPIHGHYAEGLASGTLMLLDVETILPAVFFQKES